MGLQQIKEIPSSKNTARRDDEESKEYDIIEQDQISNIIDTAVETQKAHEI